MLAGSEGIGGIAFENYELAHGIGTLALAMILFDGGLRTQLSAIRVAWKTSLLLATLRVLITAVVTGFAAAWEAVLSDRLMPLPFSRSFAPAEPDCQSESMRSWKLKVVRTIRWQYF